MAFSRPRTRASYSVVLFVDLKSILQERKCLFFSGSIRAHPALDIYCVLELSKYKIQNRYSQTTWLVSFVTLVTKLTMLQSIPPARENRRRLGYASDS